MNAIERARGVTPMRESTMTRGSTFAAFTVGGGGKGYQFGGQEGTTCVVTQWT